MRGARQEEQRQRGAGEVADYMEEILIKSTGPNVSCQACGFLLIFLSQLVFSSVQFSCSVVSDSVTP